MRDAVLNFKPLVYVYIISFLKRKSPAGTGFRTKTKLNKA